MNLSKVLKEINSLKNTDKAKNFSRFFKTEKGQYGEGDQFLGIMTQPLAKIINKYYQDLTFLDIQKLLNSPFHEHRTVAVSTLKNQFSKADCRKQPQIYEFYLKNTKFINNWDLVDISAPDIVGAYNYEQNNYADLYKLSQSTSIWERRISIVSTSFLIKKDIFLPTLEISKILINDQQDLIHKAMGWMLREVGKKDQPVLIKFLDQNCLKLPRTALRYAIEKFPDSLRLHYLKLK